MKKLRNLLVIGLTVALITLCIDWNWRVQSQNKCFPRNPRLPVPSWVSKAKANNGRWLVENRGIYASQYGSIIGPYRWVKEVDNDCPNLISPYLKNDNLEAHHLIEKRFADVLEIDENSMPAVLMTRKQHDNWTRKLQSKAEGLPVGDEYKPNDSNKIWGLYEKVYSSRPDWLDAVRAQRYQR